MKEKINENNKERFLPIGSVVLLKNGTQKVMITSYCVFPKKNKKEIYDYGGCLYPEGILESDTVAAFNHDMIDKVFFLGYETDDSRELSRVLNGGLAIYKEKLEKEENNN